MVYVALMY